MSSPHVTALFRERWTAHAAVEQLVQAGFSRDDISVLMSEQTHAREFAPASGVRALFSESSPARATTGGVLGAIVSSLVALLPGATLLAAGPLAAGPLVAPNVEGALAPAVIVEVLVRAGIPEPDAELASRRLHGGAILVGVRANGRAALARQVLALAGGNSLAAA